MRRIRSRDTAPEIQIRKIAHRLGFRFRLHRRDLPGKPDLVFPSRKKVIFVHGCFWHQHSCSEGRVPSSNSSYWAPKLARNVERDTAALQALASLGWSTLVIWECELRNEVVLVDKIQAFLSGTCEEHP
ncbi:T/G mismatch-specific endonuclease [Burkholderia sp. YR290]|nr:T/G mismatch-specific endonuclease [Burkholderia sp. YR290]